MALDWLWLLVPVVVIGAAARRRRQGSGNAGYMSHRQQKDRAAEYMSKPGMPR